VKAGLFYLLTGYVVVFLWHFELHMLWLLAFVLPALLINRYARARLVDFYIASAMCRRGKYANALERLDGFLATLERRPSLARLYPLTTFDSRFGVAAIARFYRAVCLFELGHTHDARTAFETLLQDHPGFVECYMNLAGIAVKEGHVDEAAEWLVRAKPYRNDKFIRIVQEAPFLSQVRERPEVQDVLTPNR
jgi:tetratricopeptide (TPR) repeat protein